jgi:hypothetical protein
MMLKENALNVSQEPSILMVNAMLSVIFARLGIQLEHVPNAILALTYLLEHVFPSNLQEQGQLAHRILFVFSGMLMVNALFVHMEHTFLMESAKK